MAADSSLICTMALRMVAHACLISATTIGSSKMPHGTWQWPPHRRMLRSSVEDPLML